MHSGIQNNRAYYAMNNTDRTSSPKGISTAERLWVVPETALPPVFWKGQNDQGMCAAFSGATDISESRHAWA